MSIADVLRAFKKHWVTEIILFCVAIGVTAGITSAMPTMYTAQSEVLVQASPVSDDLASAQQAMSASAQVAVASMCPDIVKSDAVLKPVIDNLGLHATVSDLRSKIDAVTSDASTVIQLTATYSDSEDSAKIVDELTSQLEKQLQKIYTSLRVSLSVVQKPVVPSAPSSLTLLPITVLALQLVSYWRLLELLFVKCLIKASMKLLMSKRLQVLRFLRRFQSLTPLLMELQLL